MEIEDVAQPVVKLCTAVLCGIDCKTRDAGGDIVTRRRRWRWRRAGVRQRWWWQWCATKGSGNGPSGRNAASRCGNLGGMEAGSTGWRRWGGLP